MKRAHLPPNASRRIRSILLTALPSLLLAISIGVTVSSFHTAQQEMADKQLALARQAQSDMDYRITQHEEIVYGLMLSVVNVVNEEWDTAGKYREYTDLSSILTPYIHRGMIASLRLYVPDQKFYSSQRDMFYPLSDLKESEYARYAEPGLHWIPTHLAKVGFDQVVPSLALMYLVQQSYNYAMPAAALIIYIPAATLNGIFGANLSGGDEMFLVDSNGITLAHSDKEQIGKTLLTPNEIIKLLRNDEGAMVSEGKIIAASRLANVEWYLVTRRAGMNLFALDSTRGLILLCLWAVTLLTLGYLVLMLLHHRLIGETMRTIRRITEGMIPEQEKESAWRKEPMLYISTSRLEKELEETIITLTHSMQRYYQNQLDLVNYQMQSLQAQIKPHFLYNTLDVINWKIADGAAEDAISMINALSRYLRMSINKTTNMVTLQQETELSRIYLELMQKRFTNRFQSTFDLEEDTLQCLLPRLILQPLMENALLHGLLYCDKPDALLQCRAWREERDLMIEVEDNGTGMRPETLDRLQQGLGDDGQGLGLDNVRKRLKLYGGSGAIMSIHSQEGMGTCVSLRLPFRIQPDGEEEACSQDRIAPCDNSR